MYFLFFANIPLKKKPVALRFNKIKFPSPKEALYQVRLKLAQLFLKDILIFVLFAYDANTDVMYPNVNTDASYYIFR